MSFIDDIYDMIFLFIDKNRGIEPNTVFVGRKQCGIMQDLYREFQYSDSGECTIHGLKVRLIDSDDYLNVGLELTD